VPDSSLPDKSIFQICLIVDDLERYSENYRKILGFDVPTDVQTTHSFDHTQASYYGQPMNARAKIVSLMMGNVAFELLQPLEEGSVWMDYLQKHGAGIHHIAFNVPRIAPAVAFFADNGYHVTQQGLFTGRTGSYAYLDTDKDLGMTLELLEHYNTHTHPASPAFPDDKGIGTDLVIQVGLVTNDLAAMAQRYMDVLGLSEPSQQETPGYQITEARFNGEPTQATAKLAFFDFGQAQLELIQPDQLPSVWRNDLNTYGDGGHHIAFKVQSTQQAVEHFAKHGIGVVQQAYYADRSGMYTYIGSKAALGVIIELLENFAQPR
jgi:catechol 2,3-dioxygenase-like lactoylglutathione lyase family enzyme